MQMTVTICGRCIRERARSRIDNVRELVEIWERTMVDDYSLQKYARKTTNDVNDVQKKSEMEDWLLHNSKQINLYMCVFCLVCFCPKCPRNVAKDVQKRWQSMRGIREMMTLREYVRMETTMCKCAVRNNVCAQESVLRETTKKDG